MNEVPPASTAFVRSPVAIPAGSGFGSSSARAMRGVASAAQARRARTPLAIAERQRFVEDSAMSLSPSLSDRIPPAFPRSDADDFFHRLHGYLAVADLPGARGVADRLHHGGDVLVARENGEEHLR